MIHRGAHIYGDGSYGRDLFGWPPQEAPTGVRHALCGMVLLPSDTAIEAEILADPRMSAYEGPYSEICTGCVAVLVQQGQAPMPVHVLPLGADKTACGAPWHSIPLRQASLWPITAFEHSKWVTCTACKAELVQKALEASGEC